MDTAMTNDTAGDQSDPHIPESTSQHVSPSRSDVAPTLSDDHALSSDTHQDFLRQEINRCHAYLDTLCDSSLNLHETPVLESSLGLWRDELFRFKLWRAEISSALSMRPASASLDDVQSEVQLLMDDLDDLNKNLQQVLEVLQRQRPPYEAEKDDAGTIEQSHHKEIPERIRMTTKITNGLFHDVKIFRRALQLQHDHRAQHYSAPSTIVSAPGHPSLERSDTSADAARPISLLDTSPTVNLSTGSTRTTSSPRTIASLRAQLPDPPSHPSQNVSASQKRETQREVSTSMARSAWIWNEQARMYYYYDSQRDEIVYQDGTRTSRSADRPSQNREMIRAFNAAGAASRASAAFPTYPTGSSNPVPSTPALGQPTYGGYIAVSRDTKPMASSSSIIASAATVSPQSIGRDFQALSVANAARSNILTNFRQTPSGVIQESFDRTSNVRTAVQTEPKQAITDPELYSKGIQAYQALQETPDDSEQIDPRFKKRKPEFFSVGRVFLILWAEPASETNQTVVSNLEIRKGRFGEAIYHKVRRFVVIRQSSLACTALPIMTYGGQGVAQTHVKNSNHAMIYSGIELPVPMLSESPQRGETGMRQHSIRVDPDDPSEKLDSRSRLDFGKPHTIHHNLKVRNFGTVNQKSMQNLLYQFQAVWSSDIRSHDQPLSGPSGEGSNELSLAELMKRGYSRKQVRAILEKRSRELKSKARKTEAEASDDEESTDSNGSDESGDDERK